MLGDRKSTKLDTSSHFLGLWAITSPLIDVSQLLSRGLVGRHRAAHGKRQDSVMQCVYNKKTMLHHNIS